VAGSPMLAVRRRQFMTLLGGAATWPIAAKGQQLDRLRLVGVLLLGNADAEFFLTELREGLRKSGYVEGRNVLFEVRSADGKLDSLPRLAAELVALQVDVIVAHFTLCALAAKQATREIPIVFLAGDAVGSGLVASLTRPGGNLTGMSAMAAELQANAWNYCATCFRMCAVLLLSATLPIRSRNRSSIKSNLRVAPPALRLTQL